MTTRSLALTRRQILAAAVAAEADPRSVVRYLTGQENKGVVRQRIERAFRKLKLPRPTPAEGAYPRRAHR